MHDEIQFTEVDLVLEEGVAVAGHLDEEFVHQVLCDFWIFQSLQVMHGL